MMSPKSQDALKQVSEIGSAMLWRDDGDGFDLIRRKPDGTTVRLHLPDELTPAIKSMFG